MPRTGSLLTYIAATVLAEIALGEVASADLALYHQHTLLLHLLVELADHLVGVTLRGIQGLSDFPPRRPPVYSFVSPILEPLSNITDT